ncbi:Dabb family protein [Spirochaeta africana]|uniref:Putative enzyme involved in biosynthesis of extracellular polysaccharides n=1 Tax=Spirochaeta africana (strain ATCC 700263 / DSM 8902 / Z-7692) TaxID=889378 RepID=H9UM42_SPIAZ|nr:Dabb family protein [Spirochaeta africana]AFG38585.1 putative enzyme involved in biosynthesis of extracellular polysaccharides [Spirochaeta africana DSM 8902]
MIVHIVMWRLKPDLDDKQDALKHIIGALESLPGTVPQIRSFEVGAPNLSTSPAGFDVALYSRFDSLEDLDAYRVHPAHQKVAELIQSLVSERAVVDYQA